MQTKSFHFNLVNEGSDPKITLTRSDSDSDSDTPIQIIKKFNISEYTITVNLEFYSESGRNNVYDDQERHHKI